MLSERPLLLGDVHLPRSVLRVLARRLRRVAQAARVTTEEWQTLGIRIVDDAEMARLHWDFMGEPGPTDVMAFPASRHERPQWENWVDAGDDDADDDEDGDTGDADDDEDGDTGDADDDADDDEDDEVWDEDDASRDDDDGLGDIVIDWDQVRRQARDSSLGALLDEATVLLVHGLCHLLGHDHRTRGEGRRMHRAEVRLLRAVAVADVPRPYASADRRLATSTGLVTMHATPSRLRRSR